MQAVVRNSAVQVVDVVKPDIGGEPLQDLRHHIVRAAVQRGGLQAPVIRFIPMRVLELMLDEEEPAGEDQGGFGGRPTSSLC